MEAGTKKCANFLKPNTGLGKPKQYVASGFLYQNVFRLLCVTFGQIVSDDSCYKIGEAESIVPFDTTLIKR
jgi:hypothetical protein